MFAAASGARLAHRHNKTVRKQISASQIEDLQAINKGYQRQHQIKYSDIQRNRFAGIPHRRPNYSSKLYSDSNLKLSSSYIDINGRIARLGHVDFESPTAEVNCALRPNWSSLGTPSNFFGFENITKKYKTREIFFDSENFNRISKKYKPMPGKAAWQDRELNHELEARESVCITSEAAITQRTKQKEAHIRWVKRNRIHDLSFGDCNSDEELLYGAQNGAANLLLYVGLGTMCVGMIIAFVGTGEKGFKTMELRLIGPSLIGAGVLIIILRIMLCVCPSKCLKLKKHKHKLKNSTNKLNSEGNPIIQEISSSREPRSEDSVKENPEKSNEGKKRVSIAMLPTTSGLNTNSSQNLKTPKTPLGESPNLFAVPTISFLENEKLNKLKDTASKKISNLTISEIEEKEDKINFKLIPSCGSECDLTSFGSESSFRRNFSNVPETLVSPDNSDISITSLVNVSSLPEPEEPKKEGKISKFETSRVSKNVIPTEIVLSPSNLNDAKESDY